MFQLRLRPLRMDDESAFVAAHRAMADEDFAFGLGYEEDTPWSAYIDRLESHRQGLCLPAEHVPSTFLVADVNGLIVGRTSIRLELNEFLAREGGHIGYGVLPGQRRLGYATEILRQSLAIARTVGVDRVLVTCDDANAASIATIERCGGVLESLVDSTHGGTRKRRYWID